MHVNKEHHFYYHADANALGGYLTQPLQRTVSARSSVSLAQAGGHESARAKPFSLDGLISFQAAEVTVSGGESHEDRGWRSVSTASIEGLNILHVVTADRLVARVSVTHFRDERRLPEISFVGAQFVNLRLNGKPLDPKLDFGLLYGSKEEPRDREEHCDREEPCRKEGQPDPAAAELPRHAPLTFKGLVERLECRSGMIEAQNRKAAEMGTRFQGHSPQTDLNAKGEALCSMVESVTVEAPATKHRHAIYVPDFGNIFLGEMRLTPFSAQLTMLRVEMGCIASGQLSAATAFSNGSTMP